jgi:oxygen-dependent protoporphyrinogen oxidase
MRIAIIGGGIAGLAAAFELELARAAGAAVDYTLFEARERLGGSLSSESVHGAIIELGPDSFLTEKPAAAALCRELGLGSDLIASNDAARKTWILVRNRLVPLPDGLMFLVPTKLIPTALTRLFSLRTKLRMGMEWLLPPPASASEDESVADLVRRHFGSETVDRLADPLLSGIYGGDATQLSAHSVLPRLVEMERQHGSLTRGMLAAHRKMRQAAGPASQPKAARPIFTTLRGGMQQLVNALEARLDPACLRRSTPVASLEKTSAGWRIAARGATEFYDAVILAAPAPVAGKLLEFTDPELSQALGAIPYSSSITVNLLYDESILPPLPEGFGFLVPAVEGRSMLACTFVHRKFLGRTPPGKAVLRAFLGGIRNHAMLTEPDATLIQTVRRELGEILGPALQRTEPEAWRVSRWPSAMAQYAVGHQQRKQQIEARVALLPGLRLAGNAYDGIGIPDCIRLGRLAAQNLITASRVGDGLRCNP